MDINQKTLDKCKDLTATDLTETLLQQSRTKEQTNLICVLKDRSDELFKQCQSLQQVKAQLEKQLESCQKEVVQKQQRVELVEKRFLDLDANSRAIIVFMEEYKHQNAQLKQENKRLQTENDTLFSQKLHDKEVAVQKLTKEIKVLTEELTTKESAYHMSSQNKCGNVGGKQLNPVYPHATYEATEELLALSPPAVKLKLLKAEEQHALKEATMSKSITNLTKERDKLLRTSVEQENALQVHLGKWPLSPKRVILCYTVMSLIMLTCVFELRFKQEVQAVNADKRVKSLKSALEESLLIFLQDFEAFKDHSNSLLTKERELNKILRHLRS
uniref:Zgc:172182 n=1 Tax=Hippocampus comes TaxID=109280 RepID=A0A3Q3DLC4_HIPCM